ncbi:hypothetical protein D9613_012677 [Agrocybe pediades]|uniref:Uncharacterized protein n=1 Tax=Agrocybe pediades TaxID=84607 RepID=A0A8H4QVB6_9AGAR|nr:hypothetical protein D9613_012677 [Agrocybe pediades]
MRYDSRAQTRHTDGDDRTTIQISHLSRVLLDHRVLHGWESTSSHGIRARRSVDMGQTLVFWGSSWGYPPSVASRSPLLLFSDPGSRCPGTPIALITQHSTETNEGMLIDQDTNQESTRKCRSRYCVSRAGSDTINEKRSKRAPPQERYQILTFLEMSISVCVECLGVSLRLVVRVATCPDVVPRWCNTVPLVGEFLFLQIKSRLPTHPIIDSGFGALVKSAVECCRACDVSGGIAATGGQIHSLWVPPSMYPRDATSPWTRCSLPQMTFQPAYSRLLTSLSHVFLRLSMCPGRGSRSRSPQRERSPAKEKMSMSTGRAPSKCYGDWITVWGGGRCRSKREEGLYGGRYCISRAGSGTINEVFEAVEFRSLRASMHLVIRVEDHRDRSAYHAKLPTPAANYALQHQVNDTVPLDGGSLLRQTLSQPVHPYIFVQTQPGSRGFVEPCYSTSEVERRQVSEREHVFECRSRKRRPGLVDELQLGEAEPRKRND